MTEEAKDWFDDVTTVTICSSSKFYAKARRVADKLTHRGLVVYTPRFDYDEEVVEVGPSEKAWLTRDFLAKIKQSDAVYVIDEQGYTGRSVCIEIGFAAALGKRVFLSEPPAEAAVAALADAVVPVNAICGAEDCG